MSQPTELLAFRKRLKSFGYFNIHIKHDKLNNSWYIKANEPLGGYEINVEYKGVNHLFRKKKGSFVYLPNSKQFDYDIKFTDQ